MIVNSTVLTKVKTTKATTKRKMLKYSLVYNIENFLFIFARIQYLQCNYLTYNDWHLFVNTRVGVTVSDKIYY